HPPLEVDLLRVDEEGGIQVVDLLSGLATDEHRARLHPVDLAGALTAALRHESPMQKQRLREHGREPGEPPRARDRVPFGIEELSSRNRGLAMCAKGGEELLRAA